jgi:hypothetical protein
LQRGIPQLAQGGDAGRRPRRPVSGVDLPPLWHRGHGGQAMPRISRRGAITLGPRQEGPRLQWPHRPVPQPPSGGPGWSVQRDGDGRRGRVGLDPGARVVAAAWPKNARAVLARLCRVRNGGGDRDAAAHDVRRRRSVMAPRRDGVIGAGEMAAGVLEWSGVILMPASLAARPRERPGLPGTSAVVAPEGQTNTRAPYSYGGALHVQLSLDHWEFLRSK